MPLREARHAAQVIGVLVGDDDRGEVAGARPSLPSRKAVSPSANPQSMRMRVRSRSTTSPLPELPLPREAKRNAIRPGAPAT